jgi:hypothetical protein
MLRSEVESSPALYARIGGALYLVNIVLGFFGVFWGTRPTSERSPTTSVPPLRSSPSRWREANAERTRLDRAVG